MQLKRLTVSHYRNLKKHTFYFSPFLTLVVGVNSVGKTNLLEAIYLLLSGHGIKEDKQDELIMTGKKQTIIDGDFVEGDYIIRVKVVIDNDQFITKKNFVNGVERRYFEFSKYVPPVVLFTPQLIESLTTEPSRRRGLFDQMLCTCDIEYKKRLNNYSSAITKRNKLLERFISRETLIQELSFWNTYLVEQATYITEKREELATFYNSLRNVGNFTFRMEYVSNPLTLDRLEETLDEQIRRRSTYIGPQRDDYKIFLNLNGKGSQEFDVEIYGSRSQQRLALLWVILSQLQLYKTRLERLPILLLDDIFSELDDINAHLVIDVIKKYQTIITTNNLKIAEDIDQQHIVIKL